MQLRQINKEKKRLGIKPTYENEAAVLKSKAVEVMSMFNLDSTSFR